MNRSTVKCKTMLCESPGEQAYLNVRDIANKLHININAAYQLCKRPGFPAVRVSERRIVIPSDAFHEWMISNPGI